MRWTLTSWLLTTLVLGASVLPVAAGEDKKSSGQDQVQALAKEFKDATAAAREKSREKEGRAEQRKAFNALRPNAAEYYPRFFEIASKNTDNDAGATALVWILEHNAPKDDQKKALAGLEKNHLKSPALVKVCSSLEQDLDPSSTSFLNDLRQRSPHENVQAAATFAYALNQLNRAKWAGRARAASAEDLDRYKEYFGDDAIKSVMDLDDKKVQADAESALEVVVQKYPDHKYGRRNVVMGDRAKADLFEIRNLSIGKVAPEIEAEDIDGVVFKLSDYRGKVVVIDFWGDW